MLTYAIQKTGDDYSQLDPQGPIDYAGFIHALEQFPRAQQLAQWDDDQSGPLPALVLRHGGDQRELWVSALGAGLGEDFQLNAVAMREKKPRFGFGKPSIEKDVVTFDVESRADVDRLCQLFCSAQYAAFDEDVARLDERARERERWRRR
ncbi:MAG: hypothetical protein V4764_03535 [Burkholderia sp.]